MTDNTEKVDLLSMTPDEVAEFLSSLGEPKYRAKQIFGWMHRGEDFDGMTNISKKLRETLKEKAVVNIPTVEEKLVSKIDGTIKYLFVCPTGMSSRASSCATSTETLSASRARSDALWAASSARPQSAGL